MGQRDKVSVRMTAAEKRGLEREAAKRKVTMSDLMYCWTKASLQKVAKKHAPPSQRGD